MDKIDPELKKVFDIIMEAVEGSLVIVVGALAKEVDADKLSASLIQQLETVESGKLASPLAIFLANSALGAVERVRLDNKNNSDDSNIH